MSSSDETATPEETAEPAEAAESAEPAEAAVADQPEEAAAEPEGAPVPGWDAFRERAVPTGLAEDMVSPGAELSGVLQRSQQELRTARGSAASAAGEARHVSFELATLIGRLGQLLIGAEAPMVDSGDLKLKRLHRQFRVLKDQMLDALQESGIEVRDPLGLPAEEVADWADISGWRHGPEFTSEVVAQTFDLGVFYNDAVVRFARVAMGAPEVPGSRPPAEQPEQTAGKPEKTEPEKAEPEKTEPEKTEAEPAKTAEPAGAEAEKAARTTRQQPRKKASKKQRGGRRQARAGQQPAKQQQSRQQAGRKQSGKQSEQPREARGEASEGA